MCNHLFVPHTCLRVVDVVQDDFLEREVEKRCCEKEIASCCGLSHPPLQRPKDRASEEVPSKCVRDTANGDEHNEGGVMNRAVRQMKIPCVGGSDAGQKV